MEDIYKSKKVPFGVEKKNNPPSLEDAASLFEFIFILYMGSGICLINGVSVLSWIGNVKFEDAN